MNTEDQSKHYWLDEPRNVRRLVRLLMVICALLLLADVFYQRHVSFPLEGIWGFHAFYGFIGCVLLVLGAKEMRKLVMRDEDYYERVDD